MSSSDSDYSIDWLASDEEEEDAGSEQGGGRGLSLSLGSDCVRRASSTTSFSALMLSRAERRCPSPPSSASGEDSWGSPCTRQLHHHDGQSSEDSSAMREDEEQENRDDDDEEEEEVEEDEEERSVVGRSDDYDSPWSSPSSCTTGSYDGSESRTQCLGPRLGTGTDKGRGRPQRKRLAGHKRARSGAEGPQEEEREEQRPLHMLQTDKDRLFARKCLELQSYIPPLSSILSGLQSGRYRERLSSFQESVAMDRIQRIMGVLQNPHMGERYVNTILKVEEMLQSWFPHIRALAQHQQQQHQHQHQHHPDKHTHPDDTQQPCSKKQKLSAAGYLSRPGGVGGAMASPPGSACVYLAAAAGLGSKAALCVRDLGASPGGPYSATSLKWLHTSPICSLAAELQAQGGGFVFAAAAASLRGPVPASVPSIPPLHQDEEEDPTQDNAVSSSTDAAMPAAVGGNAKGAGGTRGKSDSGPGAGGYGGALNPLRQLGGQPPPPSLPAPHPGQSRPPLGKINAPCLERLLRSTESIISTRRGSGGMAGSGWS
ncbi:uncharacterized protein LOC134447766 [Engraulis encrasicolus]|uniref:uncharacterized protein LOC134447766 n=1 Tax=Engraulis encrasicolus TaxID=184585 RepID=UPI002FD07CC3